MSLPTFKRTNRRTDSFLINFPRHVNTILRNQVFAAMTSAPQDSRLTYLTSNNIRTVANELSAE